MIGTNVWLCGKEGRTPINGQGLYVSLWYNKIKNTSVDVPLFY